MMWFGLLNSKKMTPISNFRFYIILQFPCLHYSPSLWCWAWRSGSRSVIMSTTESRLSDCSIPAATTTSPVFGPMLWSICRTSSAKARYWRTNDDVCMIVLFWLFYILGISEKKIVSLTWIHLFKMKFANWHFSYFYLMHLKNKHNAELQRADPGTKVRGNSVLGVVFSHTMPKMDFRYSHRFSWEKTH